MTSGAGSRISRIAILYPTDPAGHVPSGIDSFIRGILKWAPADLEYTLIGATSDNRARPIGAEVAVRTGERVSRFIPVASVDPSGTRQRLPLTVRYMHGLSRLARSGKLAAYNVLDFHRIEPLWLFRRDVRPKNVTLHQDMTVIRDKSSDIMWRHAPWLYERVERRLLASVQRIFSVRQSAVDRYKALYPAIANRFAFIPTWVDSDVFKPEHDPSGAARDREALLCRTGAPAGAKILVFVGRLDSQKDPLLLLAAFEQARRSRPELHLVMVGDGNLREVVERTISTMGLHGHVTLTGVLPAVRIAAVLRASDMFALSSAYEGMPIAVLEALAVGLPVVTTDVGEIRRVVIDGTSGFVSQSRSTADLAAAIIHAADELPFMKGEPCRAAVIPYHPEGILSRIYDNHRAQCAFPPTDLRQ